MPRSNNAIPKTKPDASPTATTDTVDLREELAIAPRTAQEILAHEALSQALTRKTRTLLVQPSRIIIVTVPSAEWVGMIGDDLPSFSPKILVSPASGMERDKKVERKVGADALRHIQFGRTVAFVSQDPHAILDESVLAAADGTIAVRSPTAALLRKVIRKISGQTARGVTDEMASLDLPTIVTAIRPGLPARACVANMTRALDMRPAPALATGPLLTDLPLTATVRDWTEKTLADLAAVKGGQLSPDQLVFATLEGAPGTGKTLTAETLARTAGWNFISSSVGSWFTVGDGALGGVARNLKEFVDTISQSEPCIGFLDEIDSLPDRATMDNRGRDWWTPIITQFLVEIDWVKRSGKRVFLLAGTNYYTRLDEALIRPGRLHKRVNFASPQGDAEVFEFLRHFLTDELADADLTALVRYAAGATQAAMEGWVKQARALARAGRRPLQASDVLAQIVPRETRSPKDIRAIALHEVGHALVAHRLGHKVETLSIISQGISGGHTKSVTAGVIHTISEIRDTATVMLAGRAADIALGDGANSGAQADLEAATHLLLAAHECQGLDDTLLYMPAVSARPRPGAVRSVGKELTVLLDRAIAMIRAEHDLALALADRLIAARILTGTEIADHFGECPRGTTNTRSPKPGPNAQTMRVAS